MKRKKTTSVPLGLSRLQLDILRFVWSREETGKQETTVRDTFDVLYAKQKLAYSTLLTIFTSLEKKGWLKRKVSAQKTPYLYRSIKSRHEVGKQLIDWVADEFFDGDIKAIQDQLH